MDNNGKSENVETKKQKKITKVLIILIIIIAFFTILELTTGTVSKTFLDVRYSFLRLIGAEKAEGNTIGNIRNYGYIADDNKYIYYMSPNENGQYIGINRIKKNDLSGEAERLIEGPWEITGINLLNGYLYFVTFAESSSEIDTVDNQIHRMKINGSEHEIINNNEFNNDCYEIYAVDNKIYYIGTDACVYFMNLDGTNKTKMNDNATGLVGVTDDYIFYNMALKVAESDEVTYSTYIMNRDGTNPRALTGTKINDINVVGEYVYYITKERYVHKVKLDGTEDTMLTDKTAYNLNVTEDGIFFFNYYYVDDVKTGIAIYKMDLDGKNLKEIKRLEETSTSLCVIDDWIFYMDSTENSGKLELLSIDGKQSYILFSLDYSNYYYLKDEENTTSETENTVTTDNNTISNNTVTQ